MRLRFFSLLELAGKNLTGVLLAGVTGGLVRSSGGGGCLVWSAVALRVGAGVSFAVLG